MNIHRPRLPFHKALSSSFLLGVVLLVLCAGNVPSARAQSLAVVSQKVGDIVLVPGTVTVSAPIQAAVVTALASAVDLPPDSHYFAITDLRLEGNWALASILGLARLHEGQTWSLEDDGVWTGLVLLKKGARGRWVGSTQGIESFSSLIDQTPDSFVNRRAKRDLDPRRKPSEQTLDAAGSYAFPWQPGTMMMYGGLGVHANGFAGIVSGWKAVDMMSDGDTSAGHAPNQLLAAAAGTISYVCTDSHNIAIHLGDFFYTHLARTADNISRLTVGSSFAQGGLLGPLKKGTFNGPCGYANQPSTWFHVHWGFPNATLNVENWTLNMSTQNWTNGLTTVAPGKGWIMAGPPDPCLSPTLSAPADGSISTSQTIGFSWIAVTGCVHSGYMLRVKTVPTMDSGGGTILDTISSQPALSVVIPSDWNNLNLYWGVKAASAPFGSSWSVGQFSITPGAGTVPTDYGHCADEGERCAFSGPALVYYGADTNFAGPRVFTDGVDCSSASFPGSTSGAGNQCFIKGGQPAGATLCAADGGTCRFNDYVATVFYGVNGNYATRTGLANAITCSSSVFGDPFPGLGKSCYYIITGSAIVSKTFESNASRDGTITETNETSGRGGVFSNTPTFFRLGDDASNRQLRSILSFNTGALPDNTVVLAATIRFKQAGLKGGNPFATLGNIVLDVRRGPYGGDALLQSQDFEATASRNAVLTLGNDPVNGWYSGTLSASDLGLVNRLGVTQFRLRFSLDDNNNRVADFLKFYTSDYSNAGLHPTLAVTYRLP